MPLIVSTAATTYDRSEIGGGALPNDPAGIRFDDAAADTTDRNFEVRWQLNGEQWCTPRSYSLGQRGNPAPTVLVEQVGVFDTIKIEFVMSDPVRFILSGVEMEVEVLDVGGLAADPKDG